MATTSLAETGKHNIRGEPVSVTGMEYTFGAVLIATVNGRTGTLDSVIFGVDIQSDNIRGGLSSYTLVVLGTRGTESDEIRIERGVIPFRKLRRLVECDKPRAIAIGSMYELTTDEDDSVRSPRWLPHRTQLV